jgi:hypothetical protein
MGRIRSNKINRVNLTKASGKLFVTEPEYGDREVFIRIEDFLKSPEVLDILESSVGHVTKITAGTGLNGGTITSQGTISLKNTTVTPGSYTAADITIDAQGRITAAANGSAAASVGTSNEHQVTDNAGGFVTSILQETGGQIGVGGVTTSAVFALDSVIDKGFTLPTMTLTQQAAIGTPVDGLGVHIEDGTISAPYYNHSTEGWVPVGRFSVKDQFGDNAGAPGTATLGTQNYFATVRAGTGLGGLSYGPLRWSYSAGGKNILPINPDNGQYATGANNTFSLGTSSVCFLNLNLYGTTYYRSKSSGTATEIASGAAGGYTLYTSGNDGGSPQSVAGLSISPLSSTGVIAKFMSRGNTSTDARGLLLDDIVRPTSATNIKAQTMDLSAFLQIDSTSRGFLQPRLTFAQQTAITSPANGLQVHIEDGTDSVPYYNHSVDGWIPVGRYAGANVTTGSGSPIYGIVQTADPGGKLIGGNLRANSTVVTPLNQTTGAVWDSRIDLGSASAKFRDLYARRVRLYGGGWGVLFDDGQGVISGTNSQTIVFSKSNQYYASLTKASSEIGFMLYDDSPASAKTIDASAILELESTSRGFLPPRMTTVEMNAISSPATGLMIYDTTTNQWMGYDGTSWVILG